LVFVGGCATGLLISDPAAPNVRPTFDVDAVAEITSYSEYVAFADRLRALGLQEDASPGAPVCRWVSGDVVLDVMPLDAKILGFSNRWYHAAMEDHEAIVLTAELSIRCISGPVFLATKLEAFRSRGNRDYFGSRDLEDAIAVVDGRPGLIEEVRRGRADIRAYTANEWRALLLDTIFLDALSGHLPPDAASQARLPLLTERIKQLAAL
jgi:hypothetical protein